MKHKIQIIDNFLDTPLEYKNSKDPQPTQEISNKIAHSLQSNVVLQTTQTTADYIAVLYLDFPTECVNKKAVSFWLHKEFFCCRDSTYNLHRLQKASADNRVVRQA